MHARLAVQVEDDPERTCPIYLLHPGHQFLVGRGRHVDVVLPEHGVSRRHCRIHLRADGRLFVTDLGSANGTCVRGERIQPHVATRLRDGDAIGVASFAIGVSLEVLPDDDAALDLPSEEFEVRGLIGKGASGRVYAALQRWTGREVAVKVLRTVHLENPDERERFESEARLCCRVRSPHVLRVYDLRVSEDRMFLILELVNGPSLYRRMAEGPTLSAEDVLRLGEQVCRGLTAIHAEGIVHRDVKPANILLTPQGDVKLTDFGIAKDVHGARALTDSGVGLGTLPYVAPEQIMSACKADARSDIYSLGATLYCALAGRPPFQPKGPRDLMSMVEQEPPLLSAVAPQVPARICDVVHTLLAMEPSARPATASEAGEALRQVREALFPQTTTSPLPPETSATPWAVSALDESGFDRAIEA